ncbi:MAG: transposase [Ktedonobacteraceae bacterium]|nr:transposase [Ktedonobacteraceae bacterium]
MAQQIQAIYQANRKVYGGPRVHAELRAGELLRLPMCLWKKVMVMMPSKLCTKPFFCVLLSVLLSNSRASILK